MGHGRRIPQGGSFWEGALKAMLKVAEIRVDGLLLEKRVNSLALRSCSVVPRIPAVAVECGIQTQYDLASPVCIPLFLQPHLQHPQTYTTSDTPSVILSQKCLFVCLVVV